MSEVKFDPERLKAAMRATRPPMGDTKLAREAGVSRQMIYYMKNGKRNGVSAEILSKIAQALNTSVAYLMGGLAEDATPPMQKLPEPIRQLADIVSSLSEVRQEELLRIANALLAMEREMPLSVDAVNSLLRLSEEYKRSGVEGDALKDLEDLFRGNPPRWFVDLRSDQDPDKPKQE